MVHEVGEHSVVRSSGENLGVLLSRLLSHQFLVTREDAKEHLGVDVPVGVVHVVKAAVLRPITISVGSRVREDHSRIRIVIVIQIRGVRHVDDVLGLDSRLGQIRVCAARILFVN